IVETLGDGAAGRTCRRVGAHSGRGGWGAHVVRKPFRSSDDCRGRAESGAGTTLALHPPTTSVGRGDYRLTGKGANRGALRQSFLRRLGATRRGSVGCLAKLGGQGASP